MSRAPDSTARRRPPSLWRARDTARPPPVAPPAGKAAGEAPAFPNTDRPVERRGLDSQPLIQRRSLGEADAGNLRIGEHDGRHGGRIVTLAVAIERVLRRQPRAI